MPALFNAHAYRDRIKDGDVIAGVEVARKMKWDSVEQLVRFVAPDGRPSIQVFDVCSDAMSLWNETQRDGRKA